jgi:hypothetical protein
LTDVFRPYPERRGLYSPNPLHAAPSIVPAAAPFLQSGVASPRR